MRDTEEIMNTKRSLRILQILLGAVLFLYSAELVIEQLHADHHSPAFFALLILGSVEAVAAVVFLFATPIGGPALLGTFAGAAIFHILHGQPGEVGVLLIYAAAVFAVMSGRRVEREVADGQ
jgi:hypothetical protein